ncbi:disease resistance protein RPS4 [Eutrema salsugineum]|uniref:disease resistance protein RPS4 n=1 Tax=Eutrema salsugineum TaxID=72664 RepID=UPI000CED6BD3|nr:disease resistance protein RPS4 [Eutrema salsugineum]
MEEVSSSSKSKPFHLPPQHLVFVNFRGKELRNNFVSHLRNALQRHGVNIFIDTNEQKGKPLNVLFQRIEESRIALAIFSVKYTESKWCLNELVKMKECMDKGKLLIIPIFYKVKAYHVRFQRGRFGYVFKNLRNVDDDKKNQWSEALSSVADRIGFCFEGMSDENDFINCIVEEVKQALSKIPLDGTNENFVHLSKNTSMRLGKDNHEIYGLRQRLEELEEKLDLGCQETRILGVVGMPGIGKTTLARELYETWQCKFVSHGLIQDIRRTSKELGLDCLPALLLEELLGVKIPDIESTQRVYESYRSKLLRHKVLVVLDDVSDKKQIEVLLGRCDWIRQGSRIVIATNDKSLIQDVVDYTYVVPQLNHRDGLGHFGRYAFDHHSNKLNKKVIMKLSKEFVHYVRGHPLALKLLGEDLNGKDEDHWRTKLAALEQNCWQCMRDVLDVSYDELSQVHKDIFLDMACFRMEDESYVASLLDTSEAASEIKTLMNKFMIDVSDGRVEMHDLLYTFAKELCRRGYAQDGTEGHRLWHHQDITDVLKNIEEGAEVRGIFLNMNEMKREMSLDSRTFEPMRNLRYLKIYSSHCPQQCKPNNKINLPDGLNFPLKEIRYLHWVEFPLKEIPPDFNPHNLVDLKLPYSKIERIWSGDKDTSKLKWVNLNYSSNLRVLSGLSKAQNLQRLNLEGCIAMETLPHDMEYMRSLLFLNLKGCISLNCLPEINLVSLETLILSNCSGLKEFRVISKNLEALYLDGTSIKELPLNINILQRLALLNMKGCTKLKEFPDCLDDLKALKELILSDCSKFQSISATGEGIKVLEILRLDATAITEIPKISSLQCLCLNKNDQISSLPENISQFSQLKWLDLKYCKSLSSIPKLPPNLQHLDAHGCCSLKTVSNPLACLMTTQQIYSTFNFTNCNKLERSAKKDISSFAQRKCQLLSDAHNCCDGSDLEALFSTCFPGSELPTWFCHKAIGSVLELRMPPQWHENRLAGLALCAVVSFPDSQEQIRCFSVKCTLKLKVKEGSWIEFVFPVGSWGNQGNIVENIASEHVFIAYNSCSKIFKRLENQDLGCSIPTKSTQPNICSPTMASLNFTIVDDTCEIPRLEVLKCGLSFFIDGERSGNYIKKLEVAEAEQIRSAEKVSENCTSGSGSRCTDVVKRRPIQSLEPVTTDVVASPEPANNVDFQTKIVPREAQLHTCSKPSKWACFPCCNSAKHL